jgi:glycerol-3-phosphate dehydrogenase (NAD(P)+)
MSLKETEISKKVGVLGAGAFGTSLAILLSKFHEVFLFSAIKEHAESLKSSRENGFLKGFQIPEEIDVISCIKGINFDYILWCFPVAPSISILKELAVDIDKKIPIIICSKGICENGKFLSEEFEEILRGNDIGVLSGPNFAIDIASLKFSAADVGFKDLAISKKVCSDLSNKFMNLIPRDDMIGIQVAGAVKNVIAIACGILSSVDGGQNSLAALITIGLQEMVSIGEKLGARMETFYSLSGIGDLLLTASSETSRNMQFGKRLGLGESVDHIFATSNSVNEGAVCVDHIVHISGSTAAICQSVSDIMHGKKPPQSILEVFETGKSIYKEA